MERTASPRKIIVNHPKCLSLLQRNVVGCDPSTKRSQTIFRIEKPASLSVTWHCFHILNPQKRFLLDQIFVMRSF